MDLLHTIIRDPQTSRLSSRNPLGKVTAPPVNPLWYHDPHTVGGLANYSANSNTTSKPSIPSPTHPTAGLTANMGSTGDRPDIGLITGWQAALVAGDENYLSTVMAQASDEVAAQLLYSAEHTYPLYWVPYLRTGDEKYLNRIRGQWYTYQVSYRKRSFDGPLEPQTERELAWQLRNLAQLAKVDSLYAPILEKTRLYIIQQYITAGRPGRFVLHNIGPERRDQWSGATKLGVTMWQQAFVGQALAHVVMLGHESWRPILEHHFEFWRQFMEKKPKHLDNGDIYYWYSGEGEYGTWDSIMTRHEGTGPLYTQPDRVLFTGTDLGIRHARCQQVLHAMGLAVLAGVAGASEVYHEYESMVRSRAAAHQLGRLGVRDSPVVPPL